MRILIVEDEPKTAAYLRKGLSEGGYVVDCAVDGEDGLHLAHTSAYDLVILDVMLPRRDGWSIIAELRRAGKQTPVLFLTARDQVHDRVKGLELGADDYLVKPFAFPELLARIRALLRRGAPDLASKLRIADLEMDVVGHLVMRGGQVLELTAREFDLLEYLLRNQGHVVSREMLARDIWREVGRQTPLDNVIDVHVARLRGKVDQRFPKKLLHTVRGVGFIVREEMQ